MSERPHARGVTLVEVLVVVGLIGLVAGAIVLGSGALAASRLRSAAALVTTGIRVGLGRATATGRTLRLVFDLDRNRIALEESRDRMLREKEAEESAGAGAEPATEAERKAREGADRILDAPRAPRARFQPISEYGFGADDPALGRELGAGVRIRAVQTEHDGEPRTQGRAYLYLFPGGESERAVVQLERDGDPEGLTVLVSALTGRARIERGKVALDEPRRDSEFGQREDEP